MPDLENIKNIGRIYCNYTVLSAEKVFGANLKEKAKRDFKNLAAFKREPKQQINFATGNLSPIQVKISQFFGIEINDFAVAVAKTALWIAEAKMWNETKKIVQNLNDFLNDFFPLKSFNNIIEANALKIDWAEVVKPDELNFIMGNPLMLYE